MQSALPSPADIIAEAFVAQIVTVDPPFIEGIYITGSIPLQDFHPDKSDIDFVILVKELPGNHLRSTLVKIHASIQRKFRSPKLSGIYLPAEGLDVKRWNKTETLAYDAGRLKRCPFEMGPVTLFELKTKAITLHGRRATDLAIHIAETDVLQFLSGNLNTYWKTWIKHHSLPHWRSLLLILFPRFTEWVILGIARQIYTFHTREITSKTNAGYFILDYVPQRFHPLILQAIDIRNDKHRYWLTLKSSYAIRPSLSRARATLNCAEYMLQLIHQGLDQKSTRIT